MTTLFISHSSKEKAWAEELHAKLRDQQYEAPFLDSHPDDGIRAGEKWEKTLYQQLRQSRGLVVLCTANWLASPWCIAEVMMARERGKPVFMLATEDVFDERQAKVSSGSVPATEIPDFLKDTQFIPLAGRTLEEGYDSLFKSLKAVLKPQDNFPLPKSNRPYPGLELFNEDDAAVFFGRDSEIQRVEAVLTQRRRDNAEGFIVVLGASGCGKSSLVRAGVVPRLKRSTRTDGAQGRWMIPTPIFAAMGLEGLIGSLSGAFTTAGRSQDLASLRAGLGTARGGPVGVDRAIRSLREFSTELLDAGGLPDGYILLVIDQLEEVFNTPDDSDARAMLRLLLEESLDRGSPLMTLPTMRSDFMNAFQVFPGTADRFKEIPLKPMPSARFGEVIEGPADRFGLRLEPGLTERLIEDTRHDDALPLLAFTLKELYERGAADGIIEIQAYEALFPAVTVREPDGTKITSRGVSAAIKHVADEILEETGYAGLAADDPRMRDVRRAFYGLARVGTQDQVTRRTARWSNMPTSCGKVLNCFADRRLLISGRGKNGMPTLKVAHEALFRVWDTLNAWLVQDRKALMLRAQIEDAAAAWEAEGRAESLRWPAERVLDTVKEIGRTGVSLDDAADADLVHAFLGPTDPKQLERLLGLTAADNCEAGSGKYGEAWRLPLGHVARARIGDRLALLGDRRSGVGLRDGLPDIDWCLIEGGEVTLEIRFNPDDPRSEVRWLTGRVEPFSMARYPVTIAQFKAFLSACYEDGRWRLPSGLNFPSGLPPPPKHRSRHGNHPADSVNWYVAIVFCRWLGLELDKDIWLPSEFQWQLAASGGTPGRAYRQAGSLWVPNGDNLIGGSVSERIYPWGKGWDPANEPWRANTFESELGRLTAVGMYPAGASGAGVLDLAGTVWEWCANAFERPDDMRVPTGSEARAVRGGSWMDDLVNARCTYRYGFNPNNRYASVGFRVVCLSHISNR